MKYPLRWSGYFIRFSGDTVPSLRSRLIASTATLVRLRDRQFDPARFTTPVAADRKRYAPPRRLGRRVRIEERDFDGWPVYTLTPPDARGGPVLYLHGGAHAVEILPAHWSFVTTLAVRTGRPVVVPIYPLVPAVTHRDVHPVLRRLYTGLPPGAAVMGDSAGAGMALSLVANLPPDVPRPDHLVLLSPSVDLTFANPAIAAAAPRDPLLRVDHVRELGRLYAGADGPEHPRASPINGPLDHLGAVTVFTSTRDLLNADAHRLRDLAATAPGTTVTLHEAADMIHDWMLMPIPEAKTVLAHLADLLSRR